jgi:hypothetical protein
VAESASFYAQGADQILETVAAIFTDLLQDESVILW